MQRDDIKVYSVDTLQKLVYLICLYFIKMYDFYKTVETFSFLGGVQTLRGFISQMIKFVSSFQQSLCKSQIKIKKKTQE